MNERKTVNPFEIIDSLCSGERGIWLGPDIDFHLKKQTSDTQLSGSMEIPLSYFGDGSIDLEEIERYLTQGGLTNFSVKSRLMQSGVLPWFRGVEMTESGLVVPTELLSLSEKPLTNTVDSISLGRFFVPDFRRQIKDDDLELIADSLSDQSELIHGSSGLLISGPVENKAIVAIALPVERYSTLGSEKIDLEQVLSVVDRTDLDKVLQLEEVLKGDIDLKAFYLAETPEIKVPEGVVLLINPGYDDRRGFHHPSTVVDSGFQGSVRLETTSGGNELYDRVEFSAFSA